MRSHVEPVGEQRAQVRIGAGRVQLCAQRVHGAAAEPPARRHQHQRRLLSSLATFGAGEVGLPSEEVIREMLDASNLAGPARLRIVVRRIGGSMWTVEASAASCATVGPAAPPARLRQETWSSAPPLAGHKTLARLAWDLAREDDLGKLVYAPAANQNGSGVATFDFVVTDDGGTPRGALMPLSDHPHPKMFRRPTGP